MNEALATVAQRRGRSAAGQPCRERMRPGFADPGKGPLSIPETSGPSTIA